MDGCWKHWQKPVRKIEMSPRITFVLVMFGLLLLANVLMLSGFVNYATHVPSREAFANWAANAAGTGEGYEAIGIYDNLKKMPKGGMSEWREKSPNEALLGPEFKVGPDSLFIFKNNQCKPECCGASFSCGGGCVCTTPQQRDFINSRGGNRTVEETV
jgi:hypothetical protein